jgi:hypothetical protein
MCAFDAKSSQFKLPSKIQIFANLKSKFRQSEMSIFANLKLPYLGVYIRSKDHLTFLDASVSVTSNFML